MSKPEIFEHEGLRFWVEDSMMFPWPHVAGAKGWAFWNPDQKTWLLFDLDDKQIATTDVEAEVANWCLYQTQPQIPERGHPMGIEPPILENETCGMVLVEPQMRVPMRWPGMRWNAP